MNENIEKAKLEINEISLKEIINVLWKKKIKIFIVVSAFGVFSVFYSLSLNNIYTSHSVLSVVDSSDDVGLGGLAAQYGGIAAMAGIDMGGAGGNDKADLIIEKINSREFLKHLLTFDSILLNLMASDSYDTNLKIINYDSEKYDVLNNKWVRKVPKGRSLIPSYIEVHEEYLKVVGVSKDKKTGFINITASHLSPEFTATLIALIISEINFLIRTSELADSQNAISYLNNQLEITQESEIRKSINTLIKTHIETQMLASISKDYAFTPIDFPFVPEKKSGPTRSIICILITLFGFFITILYFLADYFIKNSNSENKGDNL